MKTSHEHEHFDFEAATDAPSALVDYELMEDDQAVIDTRGLEEPMAALALSKSVKTDYELIA